MGDLRQRIADLSPEKRALLERRLAQNSNDGTGGASVGRREGIDRYPLSFAQQRLWFLDKFEPDSPLYNVPSALHLAGHLDVPVLEQSLTAVVARHEALRTTFDTVDGTPVQIVGEPCPVSLRQVNLESLPADQRQEQLHALLAEESQHPFNLTKDMMLRATLFRLSWEEHILLLVTHHIASDGWSRAVLFKELSSFYRTFSGQKTCPLPDLPAQYVDYSLWQRNYLKGEVLDSLLSYWKGRLANIPPLLHLPADRPRPPALSYRGARRALILPNSLARALEDLSRHEGITLFMTMLAAFQTLLYRYTGQEDLLVGCPIAGRTRPETEDLIGFFVNTLVLRTDLSGDPSFRELLSRVREGTLDAFAHQDLPFERLVEELRPERNLSFNPLFQVTLAFQNTPPPSIDLSDLIVELLDMDTATAKFDLTLIVNISDAGELKTTLEYSTDLFDDSRISRMLGHLQTILEGVVDNPSQRISELPLLTEDERHQILIEWNDTATDYPRDRCIHELFEEQVAKAPDSIALIYQDTTLTYAEVDRRANQLAHHLHEMGVGPETIVAFCLERSAETIVTILAILKAGGAYLPLAPTYPKEHLAFMLNDARPPVVVTQGHLVDSLPELKARVVCLDMDREEIARKDDSTLSCRSTSQSLAYVMYTSGSTGRPKGVQVLHRGVVRLVKNTNYASLTADEVFLHFAPISFDVSTFEIWGALLNGARLVVYGDEVPSIEGLRRVVSQHQITVLWLTAGLFHEVTDGPLDELRSVRQLLAGGDVVSPSAVEKVFHTLPSCTVVDGYGPTEATTFSTFYTMTASNEVSDPIPIGRPIANSRTYILDRHLQPVPVGVVGELYTGGDGVARGYLKRPDLTAEKFLFDFFSTDSGARLYRTGDLARYRPDGNIEFLGRIDRQVKIRGFRVELEEVEAALREQAEVQDALVLVREYSRGDKRLVAYILPAPVHEGQATTGKSTTLASCQDELAAELHNRLRARLPEYMIPSAFVTLQSWPLTANGKVDRDALPSPDYHHPETRIRDRAARDFNEPRGKIEKRLAQIWESVLGIQSISATDNFFDLGGHSLLGMRLFAQIEREFGKQLPLASLFRWPTVAGLATQLEQFPTAADDHDILVPLQSGGSRPPFFCIHGFGGGVLDYLELARLQEPDQPFYGLQAAGVESGEDWDTTVETMASRYIAAMRSTQPSGPYRIGGYCFGGLVAFEMARQLEECGEKAALVAIFEGEPSNIKSTRPAPVLGDRLTAIWRNLPYWVEDCLHLGIQGVCRQGLWKLNSEWRAVQRRLGRSVAIELEDVVSSSMSDLPERSRRLMDAHLRATLDYVPKKYGGRVTVFRARVPTLSTVLSGSLDPELGWGPLAASVDVRPVEGRHHNIHLKPYVVSLAEQLQQCLKAVRDAC